MCVWVQLMPGLARALVNIVVQNVLSGKCMRVRVKCVCVGYGLLLMLCALYTPQLLMIVLAGVSGKYKSCIPRHRLHTFLSKRIRPTHTQNRSVR